MATSTPENPNPSGEITQQSGSVTSYFDTADVKRGYVHAFGGMVDDTNAAGEDVDTLSGKCWMTFGEGGDQFVTYQLEDKAFPAEEFDSAVLYFTGYYGAPDAEMTRASVALFLDDKANKFWFTVRGEGGGVIHEVTKANAITGATDGAVQVSQQVRE